LTRPAWGSPDWVAAVSAWVGAPVVHRETRPWSTLWTAGSLWFKENCPAHRAEASVHAAVAVAAPAYVDAPVAVEPVRGWLLTRDGGPTLGRPRDVGADELAAVLRDYAALQRATVGHEAPLVAAGLRVADPLDAAALARAHAAELAGYPPGDPRHLSPADHDRVLAALPALAAAGAALSAGPVPLALDQADLFPRNVFAPRDGGPHRFFDLADAVWAHPFGSPLLLLVEGQRRWGLPAGDGRDPRVAALLEAYLSCWTSYAPLGELRRLAEHALRIAPLHRVAAWLGILRDADAAAVARHGRTPWSWLEDVTRPVVLS
jgi:hypothetical protein